MIHFLKDSADAVEPACGRWTGTRIWTTYPGTVTCPDCNRAIGEQAMPVEVVEGDWFGRRDE